MKRSLTPFLLLWIVSCMANMASPIRPGSYSSSAFCSRDIDILKEKIHVTINKDFKTASFVIEYLIRNDVEGFQIPLLFHAKDYLGDFKVWVDNRETIVSQVPSTYASIPEFKKFSDSFSSDGNGEGTVTIYWEEETGIIYPISELKYFDADLARGESVIRVEYTASAWRNIYSWITDYSFRYSLSPAKHWKSFGSLEVMVDGSAVNSTLTTSLGKPASGDLKTTAGWSFAALPADFFEIYSAPRINAFADFLIALSPLGIAIILSLVLALFHFGIIRIYRKREPAKKYSWVVIAGSLLIPLLILIGYMLSFGLIDWAIGPVAGGYHGYTFLIILFYPLLMPVYWLIMWLMDKKIKSRITVRV